MIKIYGFEAQEKVAVAVNWRKRENFKKGDTLIVTESERLQLLRLGFKELEEKELRFSDVFSKKKSTNKNKAQEEAEKKA